MTERSPLLLQGPGGGQALRAALALSLSTGQAFRFLAAQDPIAPGMRSAQQAAVDAAAAVAGARVEGNRVGARELLFVPDAVRPGSYRLNLGRGTSVIQVFEILVGALAGAPGETRLVLEGGGYVPFAPPPSYFLEVWPRWAQGLGLEGEVSLTGEGFYPRGRWRLEARLRGGGKGGSFRPGSPRELEGVSVLAVTGNLPFHVGERQLAHVLERLHAAGVPAVGRTEVLASEAPGMVVHLSARFRRGPGLCVAVVGKRGESAEEVGDMAVRELLGCLRTGASVDSRGADQILLLAAAAGRPASFRAPRVTSHLQAVAAVVEAFHPGRIRVRERPRGGAEVAFRWVPPPKKTEQPGGDG